VFNFEEDFVVGAMEKSQERSDTDVHSRLPKIFAAFGQGLRNKQGCSVQKVVRVRYLHQDALSRRSRKHELRVWVCLVCKWLRSYLSSLLLSGQQACVYHCSFVGRILHLVPTSALMVFLRTLDGRTRSVLRSMQLLLSVVFGTEATVSKLISDPRVCLQMRRQHAACKEIVAKPADVLKQDEESKYEAIVTRTT
jgi:hypothetical protein